MTAGIVVRDLCARHRHGPQVIHQVSFDAPRGEITALLGPNGAGKSTALKAIVGLLPRSGEIRLDGQDLDRLSARERAQRVAYVPQRTQLMARMTVRSVVALGRFAHRGPLARASRKDDAIVEEALRDAGATALADRPFPELSGGEQQRVLLARALATGATALLLDVPTSSLDVRQVLDLHTTLRRLAARGCCIVVVLHDLSEVRQHADRAVLIQQGQVYAAGTTDDIIQTPPVRAVYAVDLIEGGGLGFRRPAATETRS
ncbi:MAG: ABC transporter ATP-binding protein [Myxococcota bacterium]